MNKQNEMLMATAKVVDYIGRDAVANHDAEKLELAKELARYALLSFSLQVSEHPDACLLRNVCYCILNTDGHTDIRPLLATLRERNSTR